MGKPKSIIGIISGKGGVGKSTVTAGLCQALEEMQLKVGLLDADLYGPSSQQLLPLDRYPEVREGKLYPGFSGSIATISLSAISQGEVPAMVRAPIANQLILQFLDEVNWGELDYLLIDFPPGTGDIQLTLLQQAQLAGVIAVTTPSKLSLLDVEKALHMANAMHVPLLGIIENFSYFLSEGEKKVFPFGKDGGRKLANEYTTILLEEIPLISRLSEAHERGENLLLTDPNCDAAGLFRSLAYRIHCSLLSGEKESLSEFNLEWDQSRC